MSRKGLTMTAADVLAHQAKHGFVVPATTTTEALATKTRGRMPNKTETEYQRMLQAKFPGSEIRYEKYTLKLAEGCRYVPDFAVEHADGTLEFHEVKGAFVFSKALTKPKTAAELFPQRFVLAQKLKSGWEITPLRGRADSR